MSGHYSVSKSEGSMSDLRAIFPKGEADSLNFVLFSTSGVHGTYQTIEEEEIDPIGEVTFLIVHPRLVSLRYGNARPETPEDFSFLKKLRESSKSVVAKIGVLGE